MESEKRDRERIRKETLYAIAIAIYAIMILGTGGAYECGNITLWESIYQIFVLLLGCLLWWNLIRIEETRTAHESPYGYIPHVESTWLRSSTGGWRNM